MKFILLFIIGFLTISLSSAETYQYHAELKNSQQAFQSFIDQKPHTGHLMQHILNRGFSGITPIRYCDESRICSSDIQCGFDGVCGQPVGGHPRCYCD